MLVGLSSKDTGKKKKVRTRKGGGGRDKRAYSKGKKNMGPVKRWSTLKWDFHPKPKWKGEESILMRTMGGVVFEWGWLLAFEGVELQLLTM